MKHLLDYFYEISAIPRASYNEEKIAAYLMEFAKEHQLDAYTDASHNVLIRKPASAGYENAPTIVLQGHTDMVCEKNADSAHNFDTDGIRIIREGDRLRADGTTLGADDGFAVASMMAILADSTLPHPALECLFTTAEEVGMDGMRAFDKSLLRGRMMINLDSCEESFATAACAGGVRSDFRRSCTAETARGKAIRVFVTGLCGGHSGEDINRGRGNALKLCARILSKAGDFRLIRLDGGDKDNAIPRECEAWILPEDAALAKSLIAEEANRIARELSPADSAFRCEITLEDYAGSVLSRDDSKAVLALLRVLPCGPLSMSTGIPDLVESSSNTAVIHASGEEAKITVSSRSSVESKLDDICDLLESCAVLCGFSCEHYSRYPGWDFRRDSRMQEIYLASARAVLGHEGKIIGIHAGLECGLLSREIPEMDMISIGPDMFDIHTPSEQLSVSSAERMYQLVCHMLASLKL
ncbi:MAG: aminoacyl-histidine dipeptidase [Ruminococcaceae bacterium]|nr:aminoacyl-histidine dipeptidase [Oscillospiraceae bacterium]